MSGYTSAAFNNSAPRLLPSRILLRQKYRTFSTFLWLSLWCCSIFTLESLRASSSASIRIHIALHSSVALCSFFIIRLKYIVLNFYTFKSRYPFIFTSIVHINGYSSFFISHNRRVGVTIRVKLSNLLFRYLFPIIVTILAYTV